MEVVNMEDFKKEQKRRERKEKVEKIFNKLNDNKEVAAAVFTGILTVCKVGSVIHKNHVNHKKVTEERRHRDLEIYDHAAGMYLKLKRKMTPDEVVYFQRRLKEGNEPKAVILREMNLLGK